MREKIHTLDRKTINELKEEFYAIDLETTGSDPAEDDIIEIGIVRFHDLLPKERYSTLVQTGKTIPDKVTQMTGITNHHLLNGVYMQEDIFYAIHMAMPRVGDAIFCGHRADFDIGFLEKNNEKYISKLKTFRFIDTMEQAQNAMLDVPNYKLDTVAEYYGIPTGHRHRALDDAETSGLILTELVRRADKILKFNEELEEMLK